ncbi:MAG: tetratricopeptide repeat protein, partial [Planctomycetia bacterium]
AMLAKTSVVAMPVLTLLYAWWKRGTVTVQDAVRAAPLFLISIVLGIITVQYQFGRAIGGQAMFVGGLDSRIAMTGMATLFYLATIVWPLHLLPIYPRWDVDPPKAWQFVPWLLIGGGAWWLWKHRETNWGRNAIFAFGFFLLMIAPVLGFIDISFMRVAWVADHFLYLPMIGPLALIVAALTTWLEKQNERERTAFTAVAACAMLFLGLNAFFHAITFSDEDHLWEYTLAHNSDAWAAHNRLGGRKLKRGDIDGAYQHFQNAVRLRPDLPETQTNLAIALTKKDRIDEAIEAFRAAAQAAPDMLTTRVNLADACSQAGRYAEARTVYEELIELLPSNPLVLSNYGIVLFKLGEKEKAIAQFKRALELDPNLFEARESLKVALGEADAKPASPPAPKE